MDIMVLRDDHAPRHCRYQAIDIDTYDGAGIISSTIGYGQTEKEAIVDLLEIALDECEITDDEHRELLRHYGCVPYVDPDYLREMRDDA